MASAYGSRQLDLAKAMRDASGAISGEISAILGDFQCFSVSAGLTFGEKRRSNDRAGSFEGL